MDSPETFSNTGARPGPEEDASKNGYFASPEESASGRAPTRPDAPVDGSKYTVTVDEAVELFKLAGVERPRRRIQKYCKREDLVCIKDELHGDQYLITRESIDLYISILQQAKAAALGRAGARPDAYEDTAEIQDNSPATIAIEGPRPSAPLDAPARLAAPPNVPPDDKYVVALERENEFLRAQVGVKDSQIKELSDHARESTALMQQTNLLMNGFQRLLAPLLGAGERRDPENGDTSNTGIHTNQ